MVLCSYVSGPSPRLFPLDVGVLGAVFLMITDLTRCPWTLTVLLGAKLASFNMRVHKSPRASAVFLPMAESHPVVCTCCSLSLFSCGRVPEMLPAFVSRTRATQNIPLKETFVLRLVICTTSVCSAHRG